MVNCESRIANGDPDGLAHVRGGRLPGVTGSHFAVRTSQLDPYRTIDWMMNASSSLRLGWPSSQPFTSRTRA